MHAEVLPPAQQVCLAGLGPAADVGRVVAGLADFDDAESDPQPSMLASTTWEVVKDELRDRVRRFARG